MTGTDTQPKQLYIRIPLEDANIIIEELSAFRDQILTDGNDPETGFGCWGRVDHLDKLIELLQDEYEYAEDDKEGV